MLSSLFHFPYNALHIEIVKADNGIHETVDIAFSSDRPLETKAVEYLRGVVVGRFYPLHLMGTAQIVSHQRAQQRDKVWVLHHAIQGLLELLGLHPLPAGKHKNIFNYGKS